MSDWHVDENTSDGARKRLRTIAKLRVYFSGAHEVRSIADPNPLLNMMAESFRLWSGQLSRQFPHLTGHFFLTDAAGSRLGSTKLSSASAVGITHPDLPGIVNRAASICLTSLQAVQLEDENEFACSLPIVDEAEEALGTFGYSDAGPLGNDELMLLETAGVAFMTIVEMASLKQSCDSRVESVESEAKQRELLFEAARKLHAMIDVESVLTELITCMKRLFPGAKLDLLLSQDHPNVSLPIKLLSFTCMDDLCIRSFIEGTILTEGGPEGTEVAAPLQGKQGVYGVMHLMRPDKTLERSELATIRTIAETAGNAFENAKLYEQSNLLISELRLINEITKRLNQSLKLHDIFSFASSELIHIFGADFCCILQLDKQKNEMIVQASNLPAMFHENFEIDYGFSGVVYSTKEPLIISDYWTNPKVKSKLMDITGSRSLIASPILVNSEVEGVILVTHRYPNFFSYENYKLLQVLSGHIGLAISNASLHAEVRRMVITDNLTGLYARHYLDEQVGLYQRKDYCGSLIVVDIDNFKGVNDTFGHQIGDKILVQVSNIIKACIRESDIAARWGGEELAIYLPQVSIEQAVRVAERIRNRVFRETDPRVTVSCGVADWQWEDDRISVESLFYKSDMALYKAKNDGKNQIKTG